jgi:molybdate transport system ATP-binding protein
VILVNVKKRLGDFLVQASFESNGDGVVGLFGRSGAGKTSIINMVAGLVRPDQGRIAVKDRCVYDSDGGVDLPPERRRFGYIFQDDRLFPHLSVKANLTYGMKLVPRHQRYVRLDQVVDLLGIEHLLERRPATLSGGEKQRVAIGRALLTSPDLLLMDEPLASLDSDRKSEVLPFVAKLPAEFNIPILYVSHSMAEMRSIAGRVIFIEAGRVLKEEGSITWSSGFSVSEF